MNGENNSQEKKENIYLGNAQEKSRKNGEKFLAGSICLEDIQNIPQEHITTAKNGKRYVRVVVNPYKDGKNQYGNTHSIKVDTFVPDANYRTANNELNGNG